LAPFRYELRGEQIVLEIAAEPEAIRRDFVKVMDCVREKPRGPGCGILPMKDHPHAGIYSVPFDNANLVYEVLKDHPWIWLRHVQWLKKPNH
jgi:hypothetical protein